MEDRDGINLLQIQKSDEGLAVVVRGSWFSSRPKTADFLGALGEAGIRAKCDVGADDGQFKRLSKGAYSAYIELDPRTLRQNNFEPVRKMLSAIDSELHISGPAAEASRANIYEQVAKATGLKPEEYQAAFGKSYEEIKTAVAKNQGRDDVIILPEQKYETPESDFKVFGKRQLPVTRGETAISAEHPNDERLSTVVRKLDQAGVNKAAIVNIKYTPSGNDYQSVEDANLRANAAQQALAREGFTAKLSNGGMGIEITVKSPEEVLALQQQLKAFNFSEAKFDEVRKAVAAVKGASPAETAAAGAAKTHAPALHETPAEGASLLTKSVGIGMKALNVAGVAEGVVGAYQAAREGDGVGVVLNTGNVVVSGTGLALDASKTTAAEAATATGKAALGKAIPVVGTVLTVGMALNEIRKADGNFVDTDRDGHTSMGNKSAQAVESGTVATVAVAGSIGTTAALTTAGGVVAAGAGATAAAVIAPVAAVTLTAIDAKMAHENWREYKKIDNETARNFQPTRLDLDKQLGEAPSAYKYKNLPAVMGDISQRIRDDQINGKVDRTADGHMADPRQFNLNDPKNLQAYERALNDEIASQKEKMAHDAPTLPRWISWGDSANKYNAEKIEMTQLEAAHKELAMYKQEQKDYQAKAEKQPQFNSFALTLAQDNLVKNSEGTAMAQKSLDAKTAELHQSRGSLIVASAQPGPNGPVQSPPGSAPVVHGAGSSGTDGNANRGLSSSDGQDRQRRNNSAPGAG